MFSFNFYFVDLLTGSLILIFALDDDLLFEWWSFISMMIFYLNDDLLFEWWSYRALSENFFNVKHLPSKKKCDSLFRLCRSCPLSLSCQDSYILHYPGLFYLDWIFVKLLLRLFDSSTCIHFHALTRTCEQECVRHSNSKDSGFFHIIVIFLPVLQFLILSCNCLESLSSVGFYVGLAYFSYRKGQAFPSNIKYLF